MKAKNPHAVALGEMSSTKMTKEERQARASKGGLARWEGWSKEQKTDYFRALALRRKTKKI